jgi:hypothetical protein
MRLQPQCWAALLVLAPLFGIAAVPVKADPLEHRIAVTTDRFVAAVRRCGVEPRFVPAVQVLSGPAVISYDSDKRTLFIGRWETLPPPIQGFFAQWAAKDFPGRPPQQLFDTLFNGFLVGHELGHWVADQSGHLAMLDHYEAEIEANRFAIAFSDLSGRRQTAKTVARFSYLSTLPNPVPPGEEPRAWFNAHYWNLARTNPLAYNWYQGKFIAEAWEQRGAADFCQLAKLGATIPG